MLCLLLHILGIAWVNRLVRPVGAGAYSAGGRYCDFAVTAHHQTSDPSSPCGGLVVISASFRRGDRGVTRYVGDAVANSHGDDLGVFAFVVQ